MNCFLAPASGAAFRVIARLLLCVAIGGDGLRAYRALADLPPAGDPCPNATEPICLGRRMQLQSAGITGVVVLELVVSQTGAVTEARVIRGLESAIDIRAVKQARRLRFKPGTCSGKPVAMYVTLTVRVGPSVKAAA
jgi:TonB family protein